jgi:hypothetical protein
MRLSLISGTLPDRAWEVLNKVYTSKRGLSPVPSWCAIFSGADTIHRSFALAGATSLARNHAHNPGCIPLDRAVL